ncbi:HPr family phosphocarrier protein [Pontibacillus yanchengensis]|uniref:HPr family phosphocarrier protein n=2 Tax=Pontibacillus yanchengensis TaxID=462910 RepID=A0ACC7VFA9_9BACI|nr:HPr family phosphocarrier protein [Pontibacillus yanchengensis]MYL32036.1 HPr family phosphocarrier protein [Pontibacillus yanchengensis]MYL52614.1 HPr family phosphocarrier protein [Pontibacillus yanchengensis]
MSELSKVITVNIDETQTIIELSNKIQRFDSEIFLKKYVDGSMIEVNLKSFLGLINLRLTNGDEITVRCIGEDSEEALNEVREWLT